jgi:predicted nucleic-acid-binding protein
MRAIDTNILVRLLTRDDEAQTKSAEAFVVKGAWVSHLVLAETVWVLDSVYGLAPAQIQSALEMLLNHRDLVIEKADVVASALIHFQRKPVLGFTDCLVLETARNAGHLPLGTLDRNLAKLEGAQRLI